MGLARLPSPGQREPEPAAPPYLSTEDRRFTPPPAVAVLAARHCRLTSCQASTPAHRQAATWSPACRLALTAQPWTPQWRVRPTYCGCVWLGGSGAPSRSPCRLLYSWCNARFLALCLGCRQLLLLLLLLRLSER